MGNIDRAYACLTNIPPDEVNNKVLMLMERGTINQARADYQSSASDWQKATAIAKQLDYYSLSQGSTSYVVNDNVMAFYGAPYERTLLHTLNAQNYLAMAKWDDAAVDARNIVKRLKDLNGFPDDAFSHYVAAFSFEMDGDTDGARLEYKRVADLIKGIVTVDDKTGRISLPESPDKKEESASHRNSYSNQAELVCFIFSGRIPSQQYCYNPNSIWMPDSYAEVYTRGKYLGRSHVLTNTGKLMVDTERRLAAMKVAKEVTRIVVKEAISDAISRQNELLGELVRILLFSLEAPDLRRWETLPLTMQVARFPCPPDIKEFNVVFKSCNGITLKEKTVSAPLTHRGNIYFSFCRDL